MHVVDVGRPSSQLTNQSAQIWSHLQHIDQNNTTRLQRGLADRPKHNDNFLQITNLALTF